MKEVEEIRGVGDLVKIVREHIRLKKRGAKMIGDCPFCKSKNQFTVDHEKQLFHCFGCAKGGDIFTFVMEKLNLSFPEALKLLTKKYEKKIDDWKFQSLTAQVRDFQEALKECFDSWRSDEMKDKQFIFKISNLIETGPLDEEVETPF